MKFLWGSALPTPFVYIYLFKDIKSWHTVILGHYIISLRFFHIKIYFY
jgi:hypothetical protein